MRYARILSLAGAAALLLIAVFVPADVSAKMTKCGVAAARNFCLEYETENVTVGQGQVYTIVGGTAPFTIHFVQNGDKVRLERIGDRSFRLTAVKETTGFGVGPVQFFAGETGGYKSATGHGLLYISPVKATGPKPEPPVPHPPTRPVPCDITGVWRHGTHETWTFAALGGGRYSAREEGFGNASGTAAVVGDQIRIEYVTRDGKIGGHYSLQLSGDCRSMSGRWSDSRRASGQARMVRLTDSPGRPQATPGMAGSVDPGWEFMVATGKGTGFEPGTGQVVAMADNVLAILHNAVNRGGAVVTKPIPIVPGKILKITKETMVHYGGNNYTGMTAVLGQDPAREILAAAGYYHYDTENYFGAGFLKTPARIQPVWDAWFTEVITYDPATGRLTLSINNGPVLAYGGKPASGPIRVGMHSYGWGTGHFQKVRGMLLEWTN